MGNSVRQIWDNCLQFIKNNINANSFRLWFEPIEPVKVVDCTLTIQVPSSFFYEYLEDNYVEILHAALQRELGPDAKLIYNIVIRIYNEVIKIIINFHHVKDCTI